MSVTNVYDQAHLLARSIKASAEYANFRLAAARLEAEKSSLAILRDFRRRQFELQSRLIRGEEVDAAEQERFARLSDIISSHVVISAFLQAEYVLSRLLGDIQKIIADAVDVELSWPSATEAEEVGRAAESAGAAGAAEAAEVAEAPEVETPDRLAAKEQGPKVPECTG